MTLKLLKKNEIQQLKSQAEKQAIDEGVKLAKRVDRLREVAAEEETSLEQFRVKTVAVIKQEIQTLSVEKETLQSEVKDLEDRRKAALEPLDAQWQRLADCEADLKRQSEEINSRLNELNTLLEHTTTSVAEAEKRIAHIDTLEDTATKKLLEADNFHRESETNVEETRRIREEAETFAKTKETELANREKQCADTENSIILREEKLEADKSALLNEWRLLEDRKATFERSIKRLKK